MPDIKKLTIDQMGNRLIVAMDHNDQETFNQYFNPDTLLENKDVYFLVFRKALYHRDNYYIHRLLPNTPKEIFSKTFCLSDGRESVEVTLPMDLCRVYNFQQSRQKNKQAWERFLCSRLHLLMQCGCDPNAETTSGRTPLISAVMADSPKLVDCLLGWGAQPFSGAFDCDACYKGFDDKKAVSALYFPKNAYEWAIIRDNKSVKSVFDSYISYQQRIEAHNTFIQKRKTHLKSRRTMDRFFIGSCGVVLLFTILGMLGKCELQEKKGKDQTQITKTLKPTEKTAHSIRYTHDQNTYDR